MAVAGEIAVAADINNQITGALAPLQAFPVARMRQIATQTLTTGTYGLITFTLNEYDSHNGHSTLTNTSRYVVPNGWAGVWALTGGVGFAANGTGIRACRWLKNGSAIAASVNTAPNVGGAAACIIPAQSISPELNAGDYVELQAYQDSGGNLSTIATAESMSWMGVRFVRSL